MTANDARKRTVLILDTNTGESAYHSRQVAEAVSALEEFPDVDQARMLKMARHMAAKTWPHDLDAMPSWTQAQFREAVDSLPDSA